MSAFIWLFDNFRYFVAASLLNVILKIIFMRSILLLALILPLFTAAQINRSAREFASEKIQEYVSAKLFKDLSYKPISFGQLKEYNSKGNSEITWTIEHKFEITDTKKFSDQRTSVPKEYKFQFYLDDKMKVLKAESYFTY